METFTKFFGQMSSFLNYGFIGFCAIVLFVTGQAVVESIRDKRPNRLKLSALLGLMIVSISLAFMSLISLAKKNKTSAVDVTHSKRSKVRIKQRKERETEQGSEVSIDQSEGTDIQVEQDASADTVNLD